MKRFVAIASILFIVILVSASGQRSDGDLTKIREANCNSFRLRPNAFDYFDLDSVVNARPTGYKVNLQLSIAAKRGATIVISQTNDKTSSYYELKYNARARRAIVLRNDLMIARAKLPPSELVDVVLAVTNDNILIMTIDEKAVVTHNETDPFAINYFGFSTLGGGDKDEARFYYNCNHTSASIEAAMRDITRNIESERRILAGLKEGNCASFRTNEKAWGFFSLDSATPIGYKMYLQVSIVTNNTAVIILPSLNGPTSYGIGFNARNRWAQVLRKNNLIGRVKFPSSELVDVILTVTNDNIFAMAVDGKTVVTHNETNPFPINYFGFGSSGDDDDVRFYYKCNHAKASRVAALRNISRNLKVERKFLTGLKGVNCNSFRTHVSILEFFRLSSIVNASPSGYKVNHQLSIVANKAATIIFSPTNDKTTSYYELHFDARANWALVSRNDQPIARANFSSSELVDVVLAVTNDDILIVTIDKKTVVTHKETNPFAINYYGFGTSEGEDDDEARFYYNCNPKTASGKAAMENISRDLDIERSILAGLTGKNCSSFRTQSNYVDSFGLNRLDNARPIGYRVFLQLYVIANKTAGIFLQSVRNDKTSSAYGIQLRDKRTDTRTNEIRLIRNDIATSSVDYPLPEVADIVIAITEDDILAVTVDGKTLITYNETHPFSINYFGFSANGSIHDARFYYNCDLNQISEAAEQDREEAITTALEIESRLLSGFGRTECVSFRTQIPLYHSFDLDSVKDARPIGYKLYLHLSVKAKVLVGILLRSKVALSNYEIYIHNLSNVIRLHRNQVPISGIDYSLNEVTDVVISMADDNILALTIDGKTVIAYNETQPYPIDLFAFSSRTDDDAWVYYNCKSNQSSNTTTIRKAAIEYLTTEQGIERRLPAGRVGTDCKSFRTSASFYENFILDSVANARPGSKMYLHISVFVNKTAAIKLNSKENDKKSFEIRLNSRQNYIEVGRSGAQIFRRSYPVPEVADIIIALTDDKIFTLTIDGEKVFTYNETNPFPLDNFGFCILDDGDDARLFYNCKSEQTYDVATQCGRVKPQVRIINGDGTDEGLWPWHAGIWHTQEERQSYTCGGTLITAEVVLTAAHCLNDLDNGRLIDFSRVIVSLGKLNRYLAGPYTQEFFAQQLTVHPNYTEHENNDIAIIHLASEALFTAYVQPICLWDANQVTLDAVIDRYGAVVGWGLNELNQLPQELHLAYMPVVSHTKCLESDPDFFNTKIHDETFCAGSRNGTSVCTGDSGGGMYFIENGSYALRGIVSETKMLGLETPCDPNSYVVFTDVAQYLNWIGENIQIAIK